MLSENTEKLLKVQIIYI